MSEQHGPEMTRLLSRLFDDPTRRLLNFGIFPGPDAHKSTVEELAAAINVAFDEVESGRARSVESIDGPVAESRRDITKLLAEAKARVERMTPEEYAAMIREQAKSWARGMAPCEHGVRDWETCPDCRAEATQKEEDR